MSRANGSGLDPDLIDELRLGPSRRAPAGAAFRVEERLRRTIADLDNDRGEERLVFGAASMRKRRHRFAVRGFALVAAVLLTGVVWAAVQARLHREQRAKDETLDRQLAPARSAVSTPVEPTSVVQEGSDVPPPKRAPATNAAAAIASSRGDRTSGSSSSDLVAERALLDRARKAVGNGEYADAEQLLDTHAHQFPAGLLTEEREALAVKTLAAQNRVEEARARGARFHARFPRSFFGSAVDQALRANP